MIRKLDTLQRIEIAEGVEIQLHPTGPIPRGVAFLYDCIFKLLIFGILEVIAVFLAEPFFSVFKDVDSGSFHLGLFILLWFLVEFGYSILFEASPMGATLGKRLVGLKVVRTSGAPITWHQSVVRTMIRVVDQLPGLGVIGFLVSLSNDRFQRLGDLAADTLVVYAEPTKGKAKAEGKAKAKAEGKAKAKPKTGPVPTPADEVAPYRPITTLTREDQAAIVQYAERFTEWPVQRAEEMAGYLRGLTRVEGREGVTRILGMAQWIRGAG